MNSRRMFYLSTIVVIALVGLFPWNKFGRAAYDSAEYKVVTSDGKFEVREYPDLMLVATSTKMDAQGRDGSFMKLFRYISDANESDKKISMTTPVFMENDKADSAVQMGFVMPINVAVKGVPASTCEGVDVRKTSRRSLCRAAVFGSAQCQASQGVGSQASNMDGNQKPHRRRLTRI